MARNKVLSDEMRKKTIPTLELKAIEFGVETLMDVYQSIAGETVVIPVNIESLYLFTDSTACLGWLNSHSVKFDKVQKLSVFVRNRLDRIEELCKVKAVHFRHVSGHENPSDSVTRPTSYKVLQKDVFYNGPQFLSDDLDNHFDQTITIPNPLLEFPNIPSFQSITHTTDTSVMQCESVIPIEKFSCFQKMVRVTRKVFVYIANLKASVAKRKKTLNHQFKLIIA